MNEMLTQEMILRIDDILDEWSPKAIEIGIAVHRNAPIPKKYAFDDILVEYYDGIRSGNSAADMRKKCLPKYVYRELNSTPQKS